MISFIIIFLFFLHTFVARWQWLIFAINSTLPSFSLACCHVEMYEWQPLYGVPEINMENWRGRLVISGRRVLSSRQSVSIENALLCKKNLLNKPLINILFSKAPSFWWTRSLYSFSSWLLICLSLNTMFQVVYHIFLWPHIYLISEYYRVNQGLLWNNGKVIMKQSN